MARLRPRPAALCSGVSPRCSTTSLQHTYVGFFNMADHRSNSMLRLSSKQSGQKGCAVQHGRGAAPRAALPRLESVCRSRQLNRKVDTQTIGASTRCRHHTVQDIWTCAPHHGNRQPSQGPSSRWQDPPVPSPLRCGGPAGPPDIYPPKNGDIKEWPTKRT